MDKFTRNCPQCRKELSYSRKYSRDFAERNGWRCQSCGNIGKYKGGTPHTEEEKRKISKSMTGKIRTKEHCENIRLAKLGSKHPLFGKHHSAETRRKMRISAIKHIETTRGTLHSNVGKNETEILDAEELKCGHPIIRGFLIKKLGYVVDGYCFDTNTVYEVYEPRHNRTVQRDLNRETEICNLLSCDFIILWTN